MNVRSSTVHSSNTLPTLLARSDAHRIVVLVYEMCGLTGMRRSGNKERCCLRWLDG